MNQYTEDTLVQQTTAEYLEKELGWKSVYAYNSEDFGPESLLGRESDREIVLKPTLYKKLIELNPNLPEEAYKNALREITSISASQSLEEANREKFNLLLDGVQVKFKNKNGELEKRRLKIIDFQNPLNNDFLCVRELWVKGELYHRRADIAGFVNGLPLLFIECKNVYKDLETAYNGNYKDYLHTIPELFIHNAVIMFGNGIESKIGTLGSPYKFFHDWKRLHEEEPGVVDMETMLKGVCEKTNFIDLIENFILFDESAGKPKKILARNHQFLGVNRAVEAVKERQNRNGKLGVFWHTQGSGKSYSMVMFARKVLRKLGGNFTFLILTDREDLDTQIYKTFAGCGAADNDKSPCRASSGENLLELLTQHKSYIFTLIQKFNKNIEPGESCTKRDDIIVISDEAHRTQYGNLALNMRNALPNASYIGFTGTPLFSNDEITRRVFGDYVSTYDFQRAVEDKATVPLYYEARGDKLGISIGDINEKIAEKLEEYENLDIDVEQRLQKELKRDYHIITSVNRLDQVARDFVSHYSSSWETGKAMFVCIDKITCVRMHKLIEFYWDEKIKELKKKLSSVSDEQEHQYRCRQIKWMEQTKTAVMISEEQGEVEKFLNWDLDITFHRKLIKEGIELPKSMQSKPEFKNLSRLSLEDAFKESEHPFRIAIVCAMWLTGFDVPSLSTLYLDKPLKAHTLMQAIARANRVDEGKNNGMIVDYCGILKNLRKALATFAGTGDDGRGGENEEIEPARPEEELLSDLKEAVSFVREFLSSRNASLDDVIEKTGFPRNAAILAAKEAVNENDVSRKRFGVMCRAVFSKFKACLTIEGVNSFRSDYEAINIIYKSLQTDEEKADISDIIKSLHNIVDEAVTTEKNQIEDKSEVYDISSIDFEKLKKEFEKSPGKRTTVQSLKTAIEKRLKRLLEQNPLRTDFQKHYEEIVEEYNNEKERVTIERTFEALMILAEEINEEQNRAVREGLDEESLAVFDLLKKPELSQKEIKKIKKISNELLNTIKETIKNIENWKSKEATRAKMKTQIHDFLWSDITGLPDESYSEQDIKDITEEIFRHIFRVYSELPSPYYQNENHYYYVN